LPKHQQYDQALLEIEQRFALLDHGVSLDVVSVADACLAYVDHLNEIGRDKTAKETEGRFRRWVYVDPIAKIALLKLNRANLSDWRTRLSKSSLLSHGHLLA
jgi:phage host-nuclease inhibitor protein Gam